MPDERLEVSVTFDERGYIGSAPELRQAVVALSLGGLRRKIETRCCPPRSRSCCSSTASPSGNGTGGGQAQLLRSLTNGLLSRTNVCCDMRGSGFLQRKLTVPPHFTGRKFLFWWFELNTKFAQENPRAAASSEPGRLKSAHRVASSVRHSILHSIPRAPPEIA